MQRHNLHCLGRTHDDGITQRYPALNTFPKHGKILKALLFEFAID